MFSLRCKEVMRIFVVFRQTLPRVEMLRSGKTFTRTVVQRRQHTLPYRMVSMEPQELLSAERGRTFVFTNLISSNSRVVLLIALEYSG
jgi:hypothetical protein